MRSLAVEREIALAQRVLDCIENGKVYPISISKNSKLFSRPASREFSPCSMIISEDSTHVPGSDYTRVVIGVGFSTGFR
jgi:hypothetical protein